MGSASQLELGSTHVEVAGILFVFDFLMFLLAVHKKKK